MFSRYKNNQTIINTNSDGTKTRIYEMSNGLSRKIRVGIENENISYTIKEIKDSQRLDVIAGIQYGDSSLWWIIAAANGIGFAMQVKPGTQLIVPTNLEQIYQLV